VSDAPLGRVEALFHAALALPPAQRGAWLTEQADSEIARDVEELLAAHTGAGDLIGRVVAAAAASMVDPEPLVGRHVGAYRIVQLIGRGGMGSVYLAERADQEYEQRVALKVVSGGLLGGDALERFRSERQILARLEHPNIGRLLDGGTTRDGVPYLVMEYVEGDPIDVYCADRDLDVRGRLQLFGQVCAAVHHAHQNLVVHRDLKPSNILVGPDGTPKLLDFGIAKLLDAGGAQQTMTAARLLTPQNASPEQVLGAPITTASDVYSLGVLLYVLLAGEPPYSLSGSSAREVERLVCEVDPEPPSSRHVSRRAPAGRIDPDLDNVVLMALRKEPSRRYGSAAELASDLQRYLHSHPVRAHRDSWRYRAGKFVTRNRAPVAALATVMALIVAFGATMGIQARRLAEERERAEARRLQAETVSEFLAGLFSSSDPEESRGATVTARELLDRGTKKVEAELSDQPETQAHLLDIIAEVYRELGLYEESVRLFESALAAQRRAFGDEHAKVAMSTNNLAGAYMNLARYDEAERYFEQALALNRAILGDGQEVAANLANLGWALRYKGDLDGAETRLREALAVDIARAGEKNADSANKMYGLSQVLQAKAEYDEAMSLMQRSLDVRQELFGADHPAVAESTYGLASIREDLGDFAGTEDLYIGVLALDRKLYGERHPYVAADLAALGHVSLELGDAEAAVERYAAALEMKRDFLGAGHPDVALTTGHLGLARAMAGETAEGERLVREGLQLHRRALGDEHPDTAVPIAELGRVAWLAGDPTTAIRHLREALRRTGAHLGLEHPTAARLRMRLARARLARGDVRAATADARAAVAGLEAKLPSGHPTIAEARAVLGACLVRGARPADAAETLRRSAATLRAAFGAGDRRTRAALASLAAAEASR
jgi:serine/threonine-protein kinase